MIDQSSVEIMDKFWPARPVAHGVAAANLALFTEARRRLHRANGSPAGEAMLRAIAWYLAMARHQPGQQRRGGAAGGYRPSPQAKVAAALGSSWLKTTTSSRAITDRVS